MKIIAHRGESFDAPENTLAAINLAWEQNVKAVEIDIQLTADNEVVVIHDYDTLRVFGKKKFIKKTTLRELKLLNAGYFKGGNWNNEQIPKLSEVLNTVPIDGKLIIEIKSNDSILPKLKYELSQSNLQSSQIELIAFNINTIAKAKQLMPEYYMLWLLALDYSLPKWIVWNNNKRIIKKVKALNLDGVNVWAGKMLTRSYISEFKKAGLLVYSWTIDDPKKAHALLINGVDGLTTNRASWMIEQLLVIDNPVL